MGVEGDDCFYVLPGTDPFSAENNRAYRKWAYAQSTIDYAGHAAIVALLGLGKMTYRSARAHGACSDFEKARERLGNDGRLMERAQQRALRIVSTRRFTKAIHERIVPALCERGVLDPQEFEWMLYRKEPWPFSTCNGYLGVIPCEARSIRADVGCLSQLGTRSFGCARAP